MTSRATASFPGKPPWHFIAAAEKIESEAIRALYQLWAAKCAPGTIPRRSEIDPADLQPLLPNIIMVDFETSPFRVRFRLVGTRIVEVTGFEFTGRYLDEIAEQEDLRPFLECYRTACEEMQPVIRRITWRFDDKTTGDYDFAVLPLESDGRIATKAIAIECFDRLRKKYR